MFPTLLFLSEIYGILSLHRLTSNQKHSSLKRVERELYLFHIAKEEKHKKIYKNNY